MAAYVTSELLSSLGHEFDALSDADHVETLVTAASRLFDKMVGVRDDFFAAAPDPPAYTARTYYGNGTGYLPVDPYTALNPVDPVVVDADNAYELPVFEERDGMLVLYGSFVRRKTAGWVDGVRVTVSANWGFPAIPEDVQVAVAAMALNAFRTADPAFAVISNVDQNASVPQAARDTVAAYRGRYGASMGVFA